MTSPSVAIVYLCHNNLRHLAGVVGVWEKMTYPRDRVHIFLIPAASPDGIADVIRHDVLPRSGVDLPSMTLLDDGVNAGFSANNNPAIRAAIDRGADYVFLQNGDLRLDRTTIERLVALAESDATIASVQPVVCYWHDESRVNVSGGAVHVAGYGFARDNGRSVDELAYANGDDVAYVTGAAALFRASALRRVELLEEGFVMYHDDLEIGMRLRYAGFRNVLCTETKAFHDYIFSRNPKKFAWMELYRYLILFAYYKPLTLALLAPLLCAIEIGGWFLAVRGGWFRAKAWATGQWFLPKTWTLLFAMRRRAQALRVIPDKTFLRLVVGRIENQEMHSVFFERVVNPVVDGIWRTLRLFIAW